MGLCLEQACKRKYGANCGTKATGWPSTTEGAVLHAPVPASSEAHSSAYSMSPLFLSASGLTSCHCEQNKEPLLLRALRIMEGLWSAS